MSTQGFVPPKIKLGRLLLKNNLVTENQLERALEIQKTTGQKLGEILIGRNYITEEDLIEILDLQKKNFFF
jgi:type IV pilus assembly protein PilB